jgi:hypothetical protein
MLADCCVTCAVSVLLLLSRHAVECLCMHDHVLTLGSWQPAASRTVLLLHTALNFIAAAVAAANRGIEAAVSRGHCRGRAGRGRGGRGKQQRVNEDADYQAPHQGRQQQQQQAQAQRQASKPPAIDFSQVYAAALRQQQQQEAAAAAKPASARAAAAAAVGQTSLPLQQQQTFLQAQGQVKGVSLPTGSTPAASLSALQPGRPSLFDPQLTAAFQQQRDVNMRVGAATGVAAGAHGRVSMPQAGMPFSLPVPASSIPASSAPAVPSPFAPDAFNRSSAAAAAALAKPAGTGAQQAAAAAAPVSVTMRPVIASVRPGSAGMLLALQAGQQLPNSSSSSQPLIDAAAPAGNQAVRNAVQHASGPSEATTAAASVLPAQKQDATAAAAVVSEAPAVLGVAAVASAAPAVLGGGAAGLLQPAVPIVRPVLQQLNVGQAGAAGGNNASMVRGAL